MVLILLFYLLPLDDYIKSSCRREYSKNVQSVGDYGNHNGNPKTLAECSDLCAQNPKCQSFVVDQMGGMKCHLKDECFMETKRCIDGSSWDFINYQKEECSK